MADEPGYVET